MALERRSTGEDEEYQDSEERRAWTCHDDLPCFDMAGLKAAELTSARADYNALLGRYDEFRRTADILYDTEQP